MTKQNKGRKRKGKDLDEIFDFIAKEAAGKKPKMEPDPDLPGEGLFYCKECDRHFISTEVLEKHRETKPHKRRAKELRTTTKYTQKEAELAGGIG